MLRLAGLEHPRLRGIGKIRSFALDVSHVVAKDVLDLVELVVLSLIGQRRESAVWMPRGGGK